MDHKCDSTCKMGRATRSPNNISCFVCKGHFFLKCFGLDQSLYSKLSSNDSVLKFVCGKCQSSKKRASINTQSSNDNYPRILNDNIKLLIDKLSMIPPPPQSTPQNHVNPSNALNVTDHINESIKEQNLSIGNMYSLVLKLSDKVDKLHSAENETKNLSTITQLISNKLKEHSDPIKNSNENELFDSSRYFNWSMSNDHTNNTIGVMGRPSLLVKQTVDEDVLKLLKNSEELTWDTLDIIRKDLAHQKDRLNDIFNHIVALESAPSVVNSSPSISNQTESYSLDSPLIDSIKLDIIQEINDKVDIIDTKLNALSSKMENLSTSMELFPTQQHDERSTEQVTQQSSECISELGERTEFLSNSLLLNELNSSVAQPLTPDAPSSIPIIEPSITAPTSNSVTIKEFHLSKLSTNVSSEQIFDYISSKIQLQRNEVNVFRLTKKGQDLSRLKFVNFKLETNDRVAQLINDKNFWPNYCSIKPFVRKGICNFNSLHNNNVENMDFHRTQLPNTAIRLD